MAVILIRFGQEVRVIAQGGFCAIYRYFHTALDCLVSLASLLGGELHLVFLDEPAWIEYQKSGYSYFEEKANSLSV